MTRDQRALLLEVIREYVGNTVDGHAGARTGEVQEHLDETYFAWIGGTGQDAVLYYRIQSPGILIEFDHQRPSRWKDRACPAAGTSHTVVRTPNGNDHGKDLLRQHHERYRNDPDHGHAH